MLSFVEIELDLKNKLSKYRYEHSVRVAEEARSLAEKYNINIQDAYLAGLLHDVAKEFSDDENLEWIMKYNLDKDLLDEVNKKICHAEVGAVVAKELYKVSDNIVQAIKYHTVGNINMNLLDKIIFVADKIESGKNYPGIDEERILAYKNIDDALVLCLLNNKLKLSNEGRDIHKETEKLLEFLIKKI